MVVVTTVSAVNITRLVDGIVIEDGGTLAIEEGSWTLLLTIESQAKRLEYERQEIRQAALTLKHRLHYDTNGADEFVRFHVEQGWNRRLDMIAQEYQPIVKFDAATASRTRRGWFNLGGWALSKVFGVATASDIEELREHLAQVAKGDHAVMTNVHSLISVVNITRMQLSRNRHMINVLINEVKETNNMTLAAYQRIGMLQRTDRLHSMVAYLEQLTTELNREEADIRDVRNALEGGRLTENLLPMELLRNICAAAEVHGLEALPLPWYYQTLSIELVMFDDNQFIYRVRLPFTDNRKYLRYTINSYPVPMDDNGTTYQVEAATDIGLHTTAGYLFEPRECVGHQPALCLASPYRRDTYSCERGLIVSHDGDRRLCSLHRGHLISTQITQVQRGLYTLTTLGEDYTIACRGKPLHKDVFTRGLYELFVTTGCTVSGEGWQVAGEAYAFSTRMRGAIRLRVQPFDFVKYVKGLPADDMSAVFVPEGPLYTLPPVPEINDNWIPMESNDKVKHINDVYEDVTHHISVVNVLLILCVVVAMILAIVWIYRRRDRLRFFLSKKSHQLKVVKYKDDNDVIENEEKVESVHNSDDKNM